MFLGGVSLLDTSIMILFAAGRACLACNLCEEEEEVLIFLALFAPRAGGALSTYLKWVGLF